MTDSKKICPFREDEFCFEECALASHDFVSNELICAFTFLARQLALVAMNGGWGK